MEYELRVVDDGGRALRDGDEGEIMVRGPSLFLGYADAGQTAAAFDAEGFFRTGDIGVKRGDAVTLTGRKKDLIIRGGENLSPKEIEDVLHTHPAVREATAVSMPHARLGEGVCVYVIPNPGDAPTLDELVAHCFAAGLARQKAPERLELVAELPRTPSGKVKKDVLRREIAAKLAAQVTEQVTAQVTNKRA
jgi:non-ribosomal peptide synthetase component E (peptide arylation enzyme)